MFSLREVHQDELQVIGWGFTNWNLHFQAITMSQSYFPVHRLPFPHFLLFLSQSTVMLGLYHSCHKVIEGKCPEFSDCTWVRGRWNSWWRLMDTNQNGFQISVFLLLHRNYIYLVQGSEIQYWNSYFLFSSEIKKIRLLKFQKEITFYNTWLFL